MNIGPLDKRCRIERRTATQDGDYGRPLETWELVAVAWCNVRDELPSKSEAVKNGLAVAPLRTRIRMRYRRDIDAAMRLVIRRPDPQVYQIVGGPAEIGEKDGIEMFCERNSS